MRSRPALGRNHELDLLSMKPLSAHYQSMHSYSTHSFLVNKLLTRTPRTTSPHAFSQSHPRTGEIWVKNTRTRPWLVQPVPDSSSLRLCRLIAPSLALHVCGGGAVCVCVCVCVCARARERPESTHACIRTRERASERVCAHVWVCVMHVCMYVYACRTCVGT